MGKYTEDDIMRGKRILKNGMLAGFVLDQGGNERFRIIGKANQEGGTTLKQPVDTNLKQPVGLNTAVSLLQQYYQMKYY